MEESSQVLMKLDGLFEGILDGFDEREMLLIVTSDHGNMEDLSTKSHTLNPVPLLALGARHQDITRNATNLTHVAPAILNLFR
jgi:bisphosphoglycerate-independent phosphoglycerate mutase (AlkP superfamily)